MIDENDRDFCVVEVTLKNEFFIAAMADIESEVFAPLRKELSKFNAHFTSAGDHLTASKFAQVSSARQTAGGWLDRVGLFLAEKALRSISDDMSDRFVVVIPPEEYRDFLNGLPENPVVKKCISSVTLSL
jgi:hypothetical protein